MEDPIDVDKSEDEQHPGAKSPILTCARNKTQTRTEK